MFVRIVAGFALDLLLCGLSHRVQRCRAPGELIDGKGMENMKIKEKRRMRECDNDRRSLKRTGERETNATT